jgi:hypothetical protein
MSIFWWFILAVIAIGGSGTLIAQAITPAAGAAQPDPAGAAASSPDISDPFGATVSTITNDPSTWPGDESDPIWKCCHAIAFAEGYNVAGSNPLRLNNPGDISDGSTKYGSESHSGSSVTSFPDPDTGWSWLYAKVANIVGGGSQVYSRDWTWDQIAQKWAGNWSAWSNNVTSYLGVSRTSRMGDFFGV